MSISFDNAAVSDSLVFTTNSKSYTNNGNYLVFYIVYSGPSSVTSVVYDGVNGSQFGSTYDGNAGAHNDLWVVYNPSQGAKTYTITFPSAPTASRAIVASWGGVSQVTPEAQTTKTTTAGVPALSISNSVTTLTDTAWVLGFCQYGNLNVKTQSAGAGATQRAAFTSDLSMDSIGVYDSNAPITPTNSYSMTVNSADSSTGFFDLIMWSVAPQDATFTSSVLIL